MEELERKARAYDKVVGKLKQFMAQGVDPLITRADVQDFFPELKESEDEKIRKLLIRLFTSNANEKFDDVSTQEIIAWLEKQGEPKSVYITPVSITDEWIEDYWQHEKVNNPYSHDKGEEIQFDHQGFVRFCKKYCKKPIAWGEGDERNLKCIMKIIKEKAFTDYDVDEDNNMLGIYAILESWLKSLKQRYTWKVSGYKD